MATESNRRITLELETGAEPIRGHIEQDDGSRRSFWGWLELSGALRHLAAGPDPHAERPQSQPTSKEQP